MIYNKQDIEGFDRVTKLKIMNSVTGIKPANLIGTINNKGQSNLAIFSSIVHLGSSPALLGFITRPQTAEVGHTIANIQENEVYTINHIHQDFIKNAHYTSGKFDVDTSEFKRCNLTEEYIEDFKAPFVKESNFKIGMRFVEAIDIKHNETKLIIGEIEKLIFPDDAMVDGDIDLEATESIGISGLNSYYSLKKVAKHPYVRIDEVPDF
ncbi:flavin reductase family protein [Polaribacter undariae]|uniref:Flavin reductase family protein n=1 Tax=Polaribacter sejongensis TaxID=985043 RepID=A0AAJ1QWV8_9FLAO|nr:flavin reductase family protein [Polaribacter undariae]MDN3619567.1 flavin reductase family protein [Polaribacter undariae]UWD32319.1 flavin reductase family protein [Polaribacter undariae]